MITKADNLVTGCIDYFRNALAAVGRHSRFGNDKYNPGQPTHWSFDVSTAHADAIASHLAQRGEIDPETGVSHTVALAWRALALLETELIEAGAKPGRGVKRSALATLKGMAGERYGKLMHPAQEMAIDAFKSELGALPEERPCPCGDIECTYEVFPDRDSDMLPAKNGRTL
jgi:hypothetical protein